MAVAWKSGKIYDRCAYLNCYNGKYSTGHKLFRFPAHTDSRHHLWIRYAANMRLRTWASATVRRAGLCAEHFSPESFVDETRRSLRRHAVPKPYSSTDVPTKPSPALLAQIEALPRKQTRIRRNLQSGIALRESEERDARRSSDDVDEITSESETPLPLEAHIANALKTLRKVKRIKIEEQILNSDKTVILERCKNLDTCPASRRSSREDDKPRPHFHKISAGNAKKITISRPSESRRSNDSSSEQPKSEITSPEFREDAAMAELQDTEGSENADEPIYRLERFHINISKTPSKEQSSSTTSRYTGDSEHENPMSDWQAIENVRLEPALPRIPEHSDKNSQSTAEFIEEYYKSKAERSFDRCAYLNCQKGRLTSGVHLFRFPQITDPRFKTWIKNAGNPRMLYWTWSTIRRAGLCSDHFTKESFFNETRHRLLRTAVPKPFYLEKNITDVDNRNGNFSADNLLEMFHIFATECDNRDENPSNNDLIDLPSEQFENREKLKMRYPFEYPELDGTGDNGETPNSVVDCVEEENRESFASVMLKTESSNRLDDDDEADPAIVETKADPLDDANFPNCNDSPEESNGVDGVEEIRALRQQKARLCEVIKQFSDKLRNAKIRRKKLRSRLLAHGDPKTR